MSFAASKILGFLIHPLNLLLLLLILSLLLQMTRWRRNGQRLAVVLVAVLVGLSVLPVGNYLARPLENRFPALSPLPERVDGIIVLGGSVQTGLTERRGQPALNGTAERLTATVHLARRYPDARLVFSGGSGALFPGRLMEADVAAMVFRQLGLDDARVSYENRSRNTFENAVFSVAMAVPQPNEAWLLVTSAAHMPRAVGSFRRAGWPVVPYPVDYRTNPSGWPGFGGLAGARLPAFGEASREWLALLAYRLLGRTDAFFPAPG